MPVTRFAPSPTGFLHLGHGYSALFARQQAGPNGEMRLRIEDIDRTRCRPAFTAAILEDLAWFGLDWPEPVRLQSQHFGDYATGLDRLAARGLLYPCFCTRARIAAEAGTPLSAPHGATAIYPGFCRSLGATEREDRIKAGEAHSWRLDVAAASYQAGPLTWTDLGQGSFDAQPELLGDVVLSRKDFPASYHLAVTWDDALEGVEIVTRGEDLLTATHLHRLLQALLDLPVPVWHHHPLITDDSGERLAKRRNVESLRDLRDKGVSPAVLRARLGFAD
jgi:glutamyl-Q tRNA(Asp) synthetase